MTVEDYLKLKADYFDDELVITSLSEAEQFHQHFIDFAFDLRLNYGFHPQPHYRGEQCYGWDITPGLFRPPLSHISAEEGRMKEVKAIQKFEKLITQNIGDYALRRKYNQLKYGKSWDLLFQAQHARVKTSLTDWSATIINPMFFATEESNRPDIEESDAQLWWFMVPNNMIWGHIDENETFYERDPFNLTEHAMINPVIFLDNIQKRLFENRFWHQFGRFFISPTDVCNKPVNLQNTISPFLSRIRIPAESKKGIRTVLSQRGIDRRRIYVHEDPKIDELISKLNEKVFS